MIGRNYQTCFTPPHICFLALNLWEQWWMFCAKLQVHFLESQKIWIILRQVWVAGIQLLWILTNKHRIFIIMLCKGTFVFQLHINEHLPLIKNLLRSFIFVLAYLILISREFVFVSLCCNNASTIIMQIIAFISFWNLFKYILIEYLLYWINFLWLI